MVQFLLVKMHQVPKDTRESLELFAPNVLNKTSGTAVYNKKKGEKRCEAFGKFKIYFHLLIRLSPKITIIDKYNIGTDWYEAV